MTFSVCSGHAGMRLDQFLKGKMPEHSRSAIQKAIRQGSCRVNGEVECNPARSIIEGQGISLELAAQASDLVAEEGMAPVIWEDEWLAVCDKPPGLSMHPCPSQRGNTLCQRLLSRYPQLSEQGGERPGIVHRLDKDTSGLVAIALSGKSRLRLAAAFARRETSKEYLALVLGKPPATGECVEPIGRHGAIKTRMAVVPETRGGKPARTTWRRLWHSPQGNFSLLAIRIFTGRTHQIRVHMSHLGFPLLGDGTYAPGICREMAPRQMLHAWRLAIPHPENGESMAFCAPPPGDFMETAIVNALHAPLVVTTGSQGSGKSTFSRFLAECGLPMISSDAIVGELYRNAGPVAKWLKSGGNGNCLARDGSVDKGALLAAMDGDAAFRGSLEEYVHTLVYERIKQFHLEKSGCGAHAVIAEVPLYFESNGPAYFSRKPFVIGINCGENRRFRRIAENRQWPIEKIRAIEAWQWPEERKMAACDLVVDNFGDEAALRQEAGRVCALLADNAVKRVCRLREKLERLCSCAKPEEPNINFYTARPSRGDGNA